MLTRIVVSLPLEFVQDKSQTPIGTSTRFVSVVKVYVNGSPPWGLVSVAGCSGCLFGCGPSAAVSSFRAGGV